jgi:cysteine-rich repeat protein
VGSSCIETCGDGIPGNYPCDDGNNLSTDGCSSDCKIESGWSCPAARFGKCTELCDNVWKFYLPCDETSPACTNCLINPGYTCSRAWGGCSGSCGSGTGGFACDDGAANGGDLWIPDGCSMACTVDVGFTCPPIGKCTEICGDGLDFYNYGCDDGNLINGDGCSSTCSVEWGYVCYGGDPITADKCYEICGDGINLGLLWCDDHNLESGDGCSSICHVERGWSCVD